MGGLTCFPGGSEVNNQSANEGDSGLISGPRRSQPAEEQPSPCTTSTEAMLQSPGTTTTKLQLLKPAPQGQNRPSSQLGQSPCSNKDPEQPKINKIFCFFKRGLPKWCSGKESVCQHRRFKRHGFNPWVWKIPWRRAWQPTLVFLSGKFHGQSLAVYIP